MLELARRISQAKAVPDSEIEKAINDAKISRSSFEKLVNLGFFSKRKIIECRQTGSQLVALAASGIDREIGEEFSTLTCPKCGKSLSEERTAFIFDLSPSAKYLIQKNHWLTVLVSSELVELGISPSSILWNIEDGPDEVDIITIFRGSEWVFELKDREFGSGDAHRFSFRRSRLAVSKAFIVASEGVSPDAKDVFKEVQRQSREARASETPALSEPVYIEDLATLKPKLHQEAERTAMSQAVALLQSLESYSGYELRNLVKHLKPTAVTSILSASGLQAGPADDRRPRHKKRAE